jgi:16S rRNA (cytosine1402-N4)-methyltransferase
MPDKIIHIPVMPLEVIDYLCLKPDSLIIDATCGEGGHSSIIAPKIPYGKLFCVDRNGTILSRAKKHLAGFQNISYYETTFDKIFQILAQEKITKVDGILADLGISLFHLQQDTGSGFSYTDVNSLSMRLDRGPGIDAGEIVNTFSIDEIAGILYRYGEEYESRKIAAAIYYNRPYHNSAELARVIAKAKKIRRGSRIHPAAKSFQALRIYINNELEILESFIPMAVDNLLENGRCVILSYHSLEDRIVKNIFRQLEKDGDGRVLTRKPLTPSLEERERNRASRSAKMRVFEKKGSNSE